MAAATQGDDALGQLEQQLSELMAIKVFGNRVREGAQRLLDVIPSPEEEKDTDRKVRLLLLRGKAKLLLPFVSKDAEKDLHMALKLKQGSAEMWVELSECFLRRNAFKEACDALDNALRIEPQNVTALCKYSQVQRNRCGERGVTAEQKTEWVQDAVAKAREAVQVDMNDGDAWNTLSLALLAVATFEGMTYTGARKALAAMQQAARKVTDDPDVYFNKAVLESLTGEFGNAVSDCIRAHELDPARLKGTKQMCQDNAAVLQRTVSRMKNATGIGRRDFKKIQSNLTTARAKAQKAATSVVQSTLVSVVDIVTEPTMQPQALLVVDAEEAFSLLLLYGISGSTFKIGDVVSFVPRKAQQTVVPHHFPAAPQVDLDELSVTLPHIYVDANDVLLNERSLPAHSRIPLQLSSRLFA